MTFSSLKADAAGALVELRDAGREVGRVAFFAGHLLQTAGHLAQGLRPAGGGVRHDGDFITHIAEIFRNGDTGADALQAVLFAWVLLSGRFPRKAKKGAKKQGRLLLGKRPCFGFGV